MNIPTTTPENKHEINKIKKISRKVDLIASIQEQSAQEAGEICFIANQLIQATFPHSRPKTNEWVRTNGKLKITMLSPSSVGLPYGCYVRHLLVWITTQAVRNKVRMEKQYISGHELYRLDLGQSLNSFMAELGLLSTGGKDGTIGRIRQQMNSLLRTTISISSENYIQGSQLVLESDIGARVSNGSQLWWSADKPGEGALSSSWVELSPQFFNLITEGAVPLDMRVLRYIKRSPMALDIYCWATYRVSYLRKTTNIPWHSLMDQFGASYPNTNQGRKDFRNRFKVRLHTVKEVWPELAATPTSYGLRLDPCSPQVSRNPKRT